MKKKITIVLYITLINVFSFQLMAQKTNFSELIAKKANAIEQKVIAWRHDFHQNPELGNRETRTAAIVAKHLQSLGFEVKTNVAYTGVVGILKG